MFYCYNYYYFKNIYIYKYKKNIHIYIYYLLYITSRALANIQAHLGTTVSTTTESTAQETMEVDQQRLPEEVINKFDETSKA